LASAENARAIAHLDCPGGGQVWVEGTTLYIGHMRPPAGTTVVDVADPRRPRVRARIEVPEGWHSHKVRAANGLMLVNHERLGEAGDPGFGGGLAIYDVADPAAPRPIGKWPTEGKGVHRFDFDGRHAYLSASVEGFIGTIVVILDLADPATPREVGRWWLPGQWQAGGEAYPWEDWVPPRCHHPLRVGERLYVSYWHHGFVILDIADLARPRLVSAANTTPAFPHPTHTCLVLPEPQRGRRVMVVADEDVAELWPSMPAFAWVFDITVETAPVAIATVQVEGVAARPQAAMTGCHQPAERALGSLVPFAWFAQGMRLVDLADPFHPREVAHWQGEPPPGCERVSANDVAVDERGLIYLVDRQRGLDIIETPLL